MMRRRPAFTMVEVAIAAVIVGVALAASLATIGATARSARDLSDCQLGQLLADGLMSEILMQAYEDPNNSLQFGLESGESAATRSAFDDVDDYDGWSAAPPQDKAGNALPDTSGWTESVGVRRVDAANPGTVRTLETGVKRIVVTMRKGSVTVVRTALRTSAWRTLEAP